MKSQEVRSNITPRINLKCQTEAFSKHKPEYTYGVSVETPTFFQTKYAMLHTNNYGNHYNLNNTANTDKALTTVQQFHIGKQFSNSTANLKQSQFRDYKQFNCITNEDQKIKYNQSLKEFEHSQYKEEFKKIVNTKSLFRKKQGMFSSFLQQNKILYDKQKLIQQQQRQAREKAFANKMNYSETQQSAESNYYRIALPSINRIKTLYEDKLNKNYANRQSLMINKYNLNKSKNENLSFLIKTIQNLDRKNLKNKNLNYFSNKKEKAKFIEDQKNNLLRNKIFEELQKKKQQRVVKQEQYVNKRPSKQQPNFAELNNQEIQDFERIQLQKNGIRKIIKRNTLYYEQKVNENQEQQQDKLLDL